LRGTSRPQADCPDILSLFEQMSAECVTQRMHRDALVDARGDGCFMHGAVQLLFTHRVHRIEARE
jgi:hypothetical protein